jgi:flagellar hook-basal body complex protein FliE
MSAAATPPAATAPTAATTATSAVADANGAAAQSSSGGFGSVLSQALSSVQGAQSNADQLAVGAATGNLNDVTNYMVAAEQANVSTQLTVAVRNNAVQAFQQIMAMPL